MWGELRSDYSAAKSSRFRRRRTGVPAAGSGADYHYRSEADYLRLMEYARDMDRNDCIVGQMVDRAVVNCVQQGIPVDPQTGDPGMDQELWHRWDAWCKDPDLCDVAGEMTFAELEYLAFRSPLVDGDLFPLLTSGGQIQLVEAHRARTPKNTTKNVVHGILLDANRRRLQYWFTKDDLEPSTPLHKVSDITPYNARDEQGHKQVLHIYDPKRVTQTRGISAFAPIFDVMGSFEDLQFAKMVQAQVVSCFTVFRKREATYRGVGANQTGTQTTETQDDGTIRTLEGIGPGMIIKGDPGETLEGFSPNTPNSEYFPHVRLILTLIGINLGLPLVILLMDASETNFSGFRGAVDQARLGFRRIQSTRITRFHRPIYQFKVRQWLAEDPALRAAAKKPTIDLFNHRWNPPNWPYIEPVKDATARTLRLKNGLTSPRRLHAEDGQDWDDVATEMIADNEFAIRKARTQAREMNAEFAGDQQPVHWRDLLSLPAPGGIVVNWAEPLNEGQQQQPNKAGAAA